MNKKRNSAKKQEVTLFAIDGDILIFEGTMLELHTRVKNDEWARITSETIKYHIFLECLKTIAFPKLNEIWTEKDEWFRKQLELSSSRIRNIDPILAAKYDKDSITDDYSQRMSKETDNVKKLISQFRELNKGYNKVSNL